MFNIGIRPIESMPMSPETEKKPEKVKKYSASLSFLFGCACFVLAFAGLIGTIILLTINDSQPATRSIDFNGVIYVGEEITVLVKVVVAAGLLLMLGTHPIAGGSSQAIWQAMEQLVREGKGDIAELELF